MSDASSCNKNSTLCGCYTEPNYAGDFFDVDSAIVTAEDCSFACGDEGSWRLVCANATGQSVILGGGNSSPATTEKPEVDMGSVEGGQALYTPELLVDIPGVDLLSGVSYSKEGITYNVFPSYVSGVYQFLVPLMAMVAIVILMGSGLQYILARGNMDQVKKAKERMGNAVIGLVLLLAAYNIAFLIDPNLVKFGGITIADVEADPIEIAEIVESYSGGGAISDGESVTMATSGHLTVKANDKRAGKEVYTNLLTAAEAFYTATDAVGEGRNLVVSSGSRTVAAQATFYYDNCVASGTCSRPTCDPLRGQKTRSELRDMGRTAAITYITNNGDATSCNHTNNVAVDVWPEGSGDYIFDVSEMNILTAVMQQNGFCRIDSEPWHFELEPYGSSTCRRQADSSYIRDGGKSSYSTVGCVRWDADEHVCQLKETK